MEILNLNGRVRSEGPPPLMGWAFVLKIKKIRLMVIITLENKLKISKNF